MNKCIFIGRLTRNVEEKSFEWGSIAVFDLAIDRRYTRENNEKITDFIKITIKGKAVESAIKNLKKGMLISVEASAEPGSYEKNGEKVYVMNFCSNKFDILDWNDKSK